MNNHRLWFGCSMVALLASGAFGCSVEAGEGGLGEDPQAAEDGEISTEQQALCGSDLNFIYRASFGREPTSTEYNYWCRRWNTIGEIHHSMSEWVKSAAGGADRHYLIDRSYLIVFQRFPTSSEFTYWDSQVYRYGYLIDDLIKFHNDWAWWSGATVIGSYTYETFDGGYCSGWESCRPFMGIRSGSVYRF